MIFFLSVRPSSPIIPNENIIGLFILNLFVPNLLSTYNSCLGLGNDLE
jgi:hypothetical protein